MRKHILALMRLNYVLLHVLFFTWLATIAQEYANLKGHGYEQSAVDRVSQISMGERQHMMTESVKPIGTTVVESTTSPAMTTENAKKMVFLYGDNGRAL